MNNLVPGRSAWMLLAGFAALALSLVALLAACGGDVVPGEDAATVAPATEATERVRAPAPGLARNGQGNPGHRLQMRWTGQTGRTAKTG